MKVLIKKCIFQKTERRILSAWINKKGAGNKNYNGGGGWVIDKAFGVDHLVS